MIADVNGPLIVTSFPVTSVTVTAVPSPRSKTNPALIPVVLSTVNTVSPIGASVVNFVDATVPPDPVTAVTCAPETIPVPVNGDPTGGGAPVNPIISLPAAVAKLVVTVPEVPLENKLNTGFEIPAPV